jgi:hypothetical protein
VLRTSTSANAASSRAAAVSEAMTFVAPVRNAVLAGRSAGQAVHQGGDAERPGERAGQVEAPGAPLRLGQHPRGQGRDEEPDRHVNEEHPAPVEVADEQPAGDQPGGGAGHAHRGVHAHGAVPRRALGEDDGDQRQGGRRGHRPADALQGAGGEQPRLVGGEPAEQRGRREDQDAGDEDPAAP